MYIQSDFKIKSKSNMVMVRLLVLLIQESHFSSPKSIITEVFHIPKFECKLLSKSQVSKELGCSVIFFPHFSVFQDLCTGKTRKIGKKDDELYLLLNQPTQGHIPLKYWGQYVITSTHLTNTGPGRVRRITMPCYMEKILACII